MVIVNNDRIIQNNGNKMNIDEAKNIILSEKLKYCHLYDENNSAEKQDDVVIKKLDESYIVYVVDERGCAVTGSEFSFENESDALDNFIKRARLINEIWSMRNCR